MGVHAALFKGLCESLIVDVIAVESSHQYGEVVVAVYVVHRESQKLGSGGSWEEAGLQVIPIRGVSARILSTRCSIVLGFVWKQCPKPRPENSFVGDKKVLSKTTDNTASIAVFATDVRQFWGAFAVATRADFMFV